MLFKHVYHVTSRATVQLLNYLLYYFHFDEKCIQMLIRSVDITFAIDQLDAQIFNTFITILYMYMFRAISCSSSEGQIVLIQHLVSSLSVSDRPVHLCTGRSLTETDDTRWCINLLAPEFYI
jgi:hypothetical protein